MDKVRKELKELQLTTFGQVHIEGIGLVAKLTDEDVEKILNVTRQEISIPKDMMAWILKRLNGKDAPDFMLAVSVGKPLVR